MSNKKILSNTMMLYARQVLLIIVSLYTVRVILNVLGVTDFGIYSIVAGVVSLASFLTGSMSSATQRYFSFALGKGDQEQLNKLYSTNLIVYISLALVIYLLLKSPGSWYIENKVNMPSERVSASITLYGFVVFSFLANILTAPMIAIIIAHEDMRYYALISIIEAIAKLSIVFALEHLTGDKLEIYGELLLLVSVVNFLAYFIFCFFKYKECQVKKLYFDKNLFRDVVSFTGWSLFGQLSSVARNQGVTVLLAQFYNPTVVASRAIAVNVANQVNIFANNFNTGMYPSIIKSYAQSDYIKMYGLIYGGSKLTFYLMWVFSFPLMLEMRQVLYIWLGEVPAYAIDFARLALVESVVVAIGLPLATAARAPGKIKLYELSLGSIQFIILASSYFALKSSEEPHVIFYIAIFFNILMFFLRLYLVSNLVGISSLEYCKKVIRPVLLVIFTSVAFSYFISFLAIDGLWGSIISVFSNMLFISVMMYYVGLDKQWRSKIVSVIKNRLC